MTDRSPSSFGFPRRLDRAPQGIDPHQPFDPVKPAGKSLRENLPPDTARTGGPIIDLEACLDRRDELYVMDLAIAGRAVEPDVDA